MISGEVFSDDDIKQINKYMSLAINAAQYGKSKGMVRENVIMIVITNIGLWTNCL